MMMAKDVVKRLLLNYIDSLLVDSRYRVYLREVYGIDDSEVVKYLLNYRRVIECT